MDCHKLEYALELRIGSLYKYNNTDNLYSKLNNLISVLISILNAQNFSLRYV